MKKLFSVALLIGLISQFQIAKAQRPNITVTKFRDSAESSAWCEYDSTVVAYNLLQPNGYWGIYIANVTAANTMINERCFTCGKAFLPGKNYAQPAFSPNKRYILFMAEKAVHSGTSANSIPGIGMYNDLWVMKTDGSKAWRLTTLPSTGNNSAMIEPYFSPDGKEIQWDEMTDSVNIGVLKQSFGYWVIKIAPFIDDTINGPHLDSTLIRTITPGGTQAFNESYGWSPDGGRLVFASCYNQVWPLDDQIYTMDTMGNNIEQMTSTAHFIYPYTEHAFYSTDGKHILWMTNLYNTQGSSKGGDDWWIMNSDTTHQERFTYFNDTLCSYWTGDIHINGHGSFAPSGKKFLGDVGGSAAVQTDPAKSIGANYIISSNYFTGIDPVIGNTIQCNVYPDPANSSITVTVNANQNNMQYAVYNLLGSKIMEGQFKGKTTAIDISSLPGGVYLLKINDENSSVNKKFVVEKK